jgi:Domain of unknown function (DUF4440)
VTERPVRAIGTMGLVDEHSRADSDLPDILRTLERTRLRALVEADIATADEVHADDYQLITPGGGTFSKAEYLGGMADGSLRYRRFEPDGEIRVRVWESAAALRYEVNIEVVDNGIVYRDRCWHTDIYELRDGRWVAVWSHATRIRSV